MGRPGGCQPPEGWTSNDFDDSEWGPPTKATCDHWAKVWKMPCTWHEKSKYVFYRVPIPSPADIIRLAKMDGVLEETVSEEVQPIIGETDLPKADQVSWLETTSACF